MPTSEQSILLELAREKFTSGNFSDAEEKLFRAAEVGEVASMMTGVEASDDPAKAANWGTERVLRAEFIVWLCTDREASLLVTHRGIQVWGMRIDGSLDLSGANVRFPLWIWKCCLSDPIRLRDAQLPVLSLQACRLQDLFADRVMVRGAVFLRHCEVAGQIRLVGARIGENLECDAAQLSFGAGPVLTADGAIIQGKLSLLNGFNAVGEVRFPRAKVGTNLECDGARLLNPTGYALNANGIEIGGSAFFRNGFNAEGEVSLSGAIIAGCLECDGAQFSNPRGKALNADGATIEGDVFLRGGFKAEGMIDLVGARVTGSLQMRDFLDPQAIVLALSWAKIGILWDDPGSWPPAGKLFLDGFRYDRFCEASPFDAQRRKDWLHRQPPGTFLPQPYEQVAMVLRDMGYERDARLIMMEKNRERARFSRIFRQGWWWYSLFGRAIGYGYAPWRAFAMSVAMIIIGTFLFGAGFSHDLISPTKESAYEKNLNSQAASDGERRKISANYPVFNAFVYSLESFTPLLKLDQKENWAPNANHVAQARIGRWDLTITGSQLRWYLWCHIIAGWVLTTLWVGAVTGLVKS